MQKGLEYGLKNVAAIKREGGRQAPMPRNTDLPRSDCTTGNAGQQASPYRAQQSKRLRLSRGAWNLQPAPLRRTAP